jgi:type II secretory pathway component PulF
MDFDISNAASMWVGLVLGLILSGVITWWVYYRQKKISEKQDHVLAQMLKLERRMIDMERRISEKILSSDKKIDSTLENKKQ